MLASYPASILNHITPRSGIPSDSFKVGNALAVDPSKQGTGLGRWLLQRLDEVARSRGDRTLSLVTAEMMDHLIKLYGSHGFEIVHRGPPDHGKDAHIRVRMVKTL